MYGLMMVFEPTRATPVAGSCTKGMNFGNVVAKSEGTGNGDTGGRGGAGRKMECCHCGGGNLKRNCPNRVKYKGKEKALKCKGGEWCIWRADVKCAYGKTEVKGGQFHTMFTSSVDQTLGADFSEMGEGNDFTWYQLHVKGWVAQDFLVHATVNMHNNTGRAVPLTWILLDSQLTVDLIAKRKKISEHQKNTGRRIHKITLQ